MTQIVSIFAHRKQSCFFSFDTKKLCVKVSVLKYTIFAYILPLLFKFFCMGTKSNQMSTLGENGLGFNINFVVNHNMYLL